VATSSHDDDRHPDPPGIAADEIFAALDRHHHELDELKRRHQSAAVARALPSPQAPPEDAEPPLPRSDARRRLAALRRAHFRRSP
jgi:hypothetical protein